MMKSNIDELIQYYRVLSVSCTDLKNVLHDLLPSQS